MTGYSRERVNRLMEKGVRIPCPEGVDLGAEVSLDQISRNGVTIHTGSKIYGERTLIMDGAEIGYEGPVTLHNCQLGNGVKLLGGSFRESTFLEGSSMGPGAQVREACLLEEEARGAHTVGLKHTILFPFVTLGSLINYCDCLMAGGTDSKNHSEVGSSYIHFNYTPNQDKATPSMMGDVSRGVMLNQAPIFLGGQGGVVGPVQVEYGTVVAAGTIIRKDLLKGNTILLGYPSLSKSLPFHYGLFPNIRRIITLNIHYIANLLALRRWYLDVRLRFVDERSMGHHLFREAVGNLDLAIEERIKRLGEVAGRMPESIEIFKTLRGGEVSDRTVRLKEEFFMKWQQMAECLRGCIHETGDGSRKESLLEAVERSMGRQGKAYIPVIKGLEKGGVDSGVLWLQGLVKEIKDKALSFLSCIA